MAYMTYCFFLLLLKSFDKKIKYSNKKIVLILIINGKYFFIIKEYQYNDSVLE